MGPHQAFGNNPRSIEYASFWQTEFVRFCLDNNVTYAECKKEEVEKWTKRKSLTLDTNELLPNLR